MKEIKIKLKPKLIKQYNQLQKKLQKLEITGFFQPNFKVSSKVKREFETHFSKNYYSSESAGYFEAWPVMSLLLHSMEIGYRLGKNSKKIKQEKRALNKLLSVYEKIKFQPKKQNRDFNLFNIKKFVYEPNNKGYYIDLSGNKYNFNSNTFDFNLMKKSISKWEKRLNSLKLSI